MGTVIGSEQVGLWSVGLLGLGRVPVREGGGLRPEMWPSGRGTGAGPSDPTVPQDLDGDSIPF